MIFQSLFPPVPNLPLPNAHHLFFNRPDQAEWKDHVLHVDALTGKTRKWYEFRDRVKRGATAFRNPVLFPYKENDIVGILSENCIVGYLSLTSEPWADRQPSGVWIHAGVCGAYSLAIGRGRSVRSVPGITDSIRVEASRKSLQDQEDFREPAELRECPDRCQGGRILGIGWDLHSGGKSERESIVR